MMPPRGSAGKARDGRSNVTRVTYTLAPVPPFRLDLTVWALRRRPDNAVDRWDGQTYRRLYVLAGEPVELAVEQAGPPEAPILRVAPSATPLGADTEPAVAALLERLLGLRIDLAGFYRLAGPDPRLGPLARRFRGLKPPRFATVFEAVVNAIACQQVTLTLGIRLLNRLAEAGGAPAPPAAGGPAFPRPTDLATLDPDALRGLGFSRQKARALTELARVTANGSLDLDALAGLDDAAAVAHLCRLRGVGRWTAEYVLLRGLGRLGVFPGDDVGARTNLARWLGRPGALDYAGVQRALARWKPYAGLLYFHLLLDRLAAAGYLPG
jgi:DNA-3-methyladenine glycosylase II